MNPTGWDKIRGNLERPQRAVNRGREAHELFRGARGSSPGKFWKQQIKWCKSKHICIIWRRKHVFLFEQFCAWFIPFWKTRKAESLTYSSKSWVILPEKLSFFNSSFKNNKDYCTYALNCLNGYIYYKLSLKIYTALCIILNNP